MGLKLHKKGKKSSQTAKNFLRWRLFAEAYMDIGKPTYQKVVASAIQAGYSESFANSQAYKLLDYVGVRDWIERIREHRRKSDAAPAEEVLAYLTAIMRGNPMDLEWPREKDGGPQDGNEMKGGGLRELCDMDPGVVQALVAGVKRKTRIIPAGQDEEPITEHTIEYKLLDRLKAAQLLAEHHGLLGDPDKRSRLIKETKTILVGYPVDPMPLAEWERQVREMLGYNQAVDVPKLPAPQGGA